MSVESVLEERFGTLESASRQLSVDVAALNGTLQVVAELQRFTQEQALRQDEAELELARSAAEAQKRDGQTRKLSWATAIFLAVVLPFISIVVYLVLIQHVNTLLSNQRATSYGNCLIRNQATMANIAREQALAAAEPNLRLRKIHLDSVSGLKSGIVRCVAP